MKGYEKKGLLLAPVVNTTAPAAGFLLRTGIKSVLAPAGATDPLGLKCAVRFTRGEQRMRGG